MSGTVGQRFECTECGAARIVKIDAKDRDRTIGYICEECDEITEQKPEGWTDWFRDLD